MPGTPKKRTHRAKGRRRARGRLPLPLAAASVAGVLAVAAVGTAFAMDRSVVLDANGREQTVHTFGGTVQDVLDSAGITLEKGDVVAPPPDTRIASGDHVLLRSSRDVTVELDGHRVSHSVNALTLDEAFRQIGLDPEGIELSKDHDTRIPDGGLTVTAERAPRMVVMYDTVRTETRSTGATVADVLLAAGVDTGEHDIISPEPTAQAEPDMVIEVTPVLGEPVTEDRVIEAETVERDNPDLPEGERKVVTEPVDGLRKITTVTILRDGEEVEHEIENEVVTEPLDGLVEIGTKQPTPSGGAAAGLNWSALAQCESGGDPTAVNPSGGYYGLYQFSTTTWQSVGGTGLPSDASTSEQTQRAQQLYTTVDGNWQSQWPHCGAHLFE
ncbi:ubiquitin-like domain-containing protein [Nocardiopsis sp. NPDC058631]|uniref:ubiquitin-like domain-containing protein n=1 Tax=Nocardiopsis sp. NPDC058631 TaxID=3346566 RepID=UPI0036614725